MLGNQVRVDRASHWQAWEGASSLVNISADGIVPVLVRKEINAALDAHEFSVTTGDGASGGINVGSNPDEAPKAIDGDLTTTWGPDPDDSLKDWWIELNLGRVVVVKKIVIHFADEGDGDPFLQFRVMGWHQASFGRSATSGDREAGRYVLAGTDIPRFWEIGRTVRPNKTKRVFEFVPRPTVQADEQFVGDPLDRLLIIATQSDFLHAHEISPGEYDALPVSQQGAIDYYRRELSGSEHRVEERHYRNLDDDRKGPIRYYRRELPRIAEIEVITEGDNINLGLVDRGGSVIVETPGEIFKSIPTAVDGSYGTGHFKVVFRGETYEYLQDLGGLFWIDSMHFLLDLDPISEWIVDISDGARAPDGSISYTTVGPGPASVLTRTQIRYRTVMMEPEKVRYLRARFRVADDQSAWNIGINEVLLYGAGYVPEVQLTSDLILFDTSKNLISIEFDGEVPDGTSVQLQTRTGNELREENIYFDNRGNEVTEARFKKLPGSRKGEIKGRLLPGADWSTWSLPYTESGSEITSPSPRQFMQLRATLVTARADTAASLRSITVNMSDPLAAHLAGEVWPLRVDRVGEEEEYSLFIRPDFTDGTQGFDEIRIEASAGTRVELLSSRLGTDSDFESGTTTDLAAADVELVSTGADTLHFRFLSPVRRGTDVVEVKFRAAVLGNSASFRAAVREGDDGSWQRIDEGDATGLVNSQKMTVLALDGSEVIHDLALDSDAVTPNADGFNDELVMRFSVARVTGDQPVELTIYQLNGRIVRRLEERRADARGRYEMRWDGTDSSGGRVPPGIYLARLDIAVDSGSAKDTEHVQAIHLAY